MSEYVVITGLSGAGRSQAADVFEDLGWFVIDNLPAALIPKVAELAEAPGSSIDRVALVAGAGQHQDDLVPAIANLRAAGERVRILFLDASTDVLVRRYENTRRRHPLTHESLVESIEREDALFETVRAEADVVIDTSELNVHQLRDRIVEVFGSEGADQAMQIRVVSFGYKHGLPLDADLVFDLRFLPNPHWVDELRPLTGQDEAVSTYVLKQPLTKKFLRQLDGMLAVLLPGYQDEGKSYLTIAVGCTGGRHRSVALAEEIGARLRKQGVRPSVSHRDVTK